MNHVHISFSFLVALLSLWLDPAVASCYPSDPQGLNPDNLCLHYPPYYPGMPVMEGEGINSSFSRYIDYPPNQNPSRTTNGFWTGIKVDGNSRTIEFNDSESNSYTYTPTSLPAGVLRLKRHSAGSP